jgi:hypothetical protein
MRKRYKAFKSGYVNRKNNETVHRFKVARSGLRTRKALGIGTRSPRQRCLFPQIIANLAPNKITNKFIVKKSFKDWIPAFAGMTHIVMVCYQSKIIASGASLLTQISGIDTGYWILVTGCWILGAGLWLDNGFQVQISLIG